MCLIRKKKKKKTPAKLFIKIKQDTKLFSEKLTFLVSNYTIVYFLIALSETGTKNGEQV